MTQTPSPPGKETAVFSQLVGRCQLVIFDFDGVIADSELISLATLQAALRQFGVDLSLAETRDTFLGTSIETIKGYVKRYGNGDAEAFPVIWETELFVRFKTELKPVAKVFDLIDRFDAIGQRYCIASSGTLRRIEIALRAMGRLDRFAHVFSSQQVARGKPAPDLFLFAATELRTTPAECLVIEDSPLGIQAAKAAGMPSVGFTGGRHLIDVQSKHSNVLLEHGAEMVLPSFDGMKMLKIAE